MRGNDAWLLREEGDVGWMQSHCPQQEAALCPEEGFPAQGENWAAPSVESAQCWWRFLHPTHLLTVIKVQPVIFPGFSCRALRCFLSQADAHCQRSGVQSAASRTLPQPLLWRQALTGGDTSLTLSMGLMQSDLAAHFHPLICLLSTQHGDILYQSNTLFSVVTSNFYFSFHC